MISKYVYHKFRKYYLLTNPLCISDEEFLDFFENQSPDEILFEAGKSFFFDSGERKDIIKTIRKFYPKSRHMTIKKADKICNHLFNLLGSGDVYLGPRINWHCDFKVKKKWPLTYHKEIKLHSWPMDPKVPWELSRFQHLIILGKAYWYTGDEKYVREFMKEIDAWIKDNPVEFGVNWAIVMEAAIRAINWIWAYYFFNDSDVLKENFRIKLLKNLILHGRFIANNLELDKGGNHYLAGIVGLIYLGVFFKETREGKQWLSQGVRALMNEMNRQVKADGVDYEASISYHRLVTEMFLSSFILLKKNNVLLPASFRQRLEKMIDFVLYYTEPSGLAPIIGDSDDGKLHILAHNEVNDHRYLLSIGAVLFDRADFKAYSNGFNEEAFWMLGVEALKKFNRIESANCKLESKAYKEGGFYIMRKDDYYMIIHCGNIGPKGAHGHCDALSFELVVNGVKFIVDPGTYVYTASPKWRNLFRSTSYHNNIMVDKKEMNRFTYGGLFEMKNDAHPNVHSWISTEKFDFFDGWHQGYMLLKDPVIHRRQILFDKVLKYWIVKDHLYSNSLHRYDFFLHFGPMDVYFRGKKPPIIEAKNKDQHLLVVPVVTHGLKASIFKGWISDKYGNKTQAPVVRYSKMCASTGFITIFRTTKNLINDKRNFRLLGSDF